MIKIVDLPEKNAIEDSDKIIIQPVGENTSTINIQNLVNNLTERTLEQANNTIENGFRGVIVSNQKLQGSWLQKFIYNNLKFEHNETPQSEPSCYLSDKYLLINADYENYTIHLRGQIIYYAGSFYRCINDFTTLPVYYYPNLANLTKDNFDANKIRNIRQDHRNAQNPDFKDILTMEEYHYSGVRSSDPKTLNPETSPYGLPEDATYFILSDVYCVNYLFEGFRGNSSHDILVTRFHTDHVYSEWQDDPHYIIQQNGQFDYTCYEYYKIQELTPRQLMFYVPSPRDSYFWTNITNNVDADCLVKKGNKFYLKLKDWESNHSYEKGNLVIYDNTLYLCTENHTSSDWDIDNNNGYWSSSGGGEGGVMNFVKEKPYKEGSLVVYNNNLYQRITSGRDTEWVPENWYLLTNANISSLFVKYSSILPQSNSDMQDEPAEYIGISYGNYATAPANYTSYLWYKIKGENGTINLEANALVLKCTLLVENWVADDGIYKYTITRGSFSNENSKKIMDLVTDSTRPIVDIELSDNIETWKEELNNYAKICGVITDYAESGTGGQITFYCFKKPKINVNLKLRINGDIHEDRFITKGTFEEYQNTIEQQRVSLQNQINDLQTLIGSLNTTLEDILEGGD